MGCHQWGWGAVADGCEVGTRLVWGLLWLLVGWYALCWVGLLPRPSGWGCSQYSPVQGLNAEASRSSTSVFISENIFPSDDVVENQMDIFKRFR